jgi:hypothetical protein
LPRLLAEQPNGVKAFEERLDRPPEFTRVAKRVEILGRRSLGLDDQGTSFRLHPYINAMSLEFAAPGVDGHGRSHQHTALVALQTVPTESQQSLLLVAGAHEKVARMSAAFQGKVHCGIPVLR